jgi:ABC-type glycerol-3-phosphate transport system permease component
VLANLLSALPFATWVLTAFFRPLPLLAGLFQRRLLAGLTAGALKG